MDQECEKEDIKEKAAHPPVLVKGYIRPDGTSYYVVIPKEIRTILNLKGGDVLHYEGGAREKGAEAESGAIR